jgi:hypothetical protein
VSIERKDVRFKLSEIWHGGLAAVAEAEGLDIAEFVEREIVRVVRDRVHAARLIAEQAERLGIGGKIRE